MLFRSPTEWPKFLGYNKTVARDNCPVLATIGGDPFVAVGEFGKGKSAIFSSDCAPHWGPKEFTDWKASIDRDFRDWWDAIKELIDGEDISAFANKLVELDGRVGELEEFQNELTTSHSIHDGIIDSSDETILDGTSEPLEGKRVVFVVENSADLCEELEDVKRRLSAIEQAFDGLINEFTVYQILTDGGTWLYTNKPDADRTDQILDSQGGIIRGKTIFVTK